MVCNTIHHLLEHRGSAFRDLPYVQVSVVLCYKLIPIIYRILLLQLLFKKLLLLFKKLMRPTVLADLYFQVCRHVSLFKLEHWHSPVCVYCFCIFNLIESVNDSGMRLACPCVRGLLEKYLSFFLFYENLVDINEAFFMRRPWTLMREFFPHLSIASVDGKRHLSEIVFNALIGFSLLEKYPTFGWEKRNRHSWRARNHREPGKPQKSGFFIE